MALNPTLKPFGGAVGIRSPQPRTTKKGLHEDLEVEDGRKGVGLQEWPKTRELPREEWRRKAPSDCKLVDVAGSESRGFQAHLDRRPGKTSSTFVLCIRRCSLDSDQLAVDDQSCTTISAVRDSYDDHEHSRR